MKIFKNIYLHIIIPKSLFKAWEVFKSDKKNKPDVAEFGLNIEENIFKLYRELRQKTYRHSPYSGFYIFDPKRRHIHKAVVRDRVLHHAVFRVLNQIFEPTFIPTSFSCRVGKGTHKGVIKVSEMLREISQNNTKPIYVLKCDVRKFFDSVDHAILISILEKKIKDPDAQWLLREIIGSFSGSASDLFTKRGIPIGNLTSQIFANIYMNEFDQFVKHTLKVKYYARYTDDFVILGHTESELQELLSKIIIFLRDKLALELHPQKITIQKYHRGVDFLGYVVFPHNKLVRTKTRNRIFKKVRKRVKSYKRGVISEETLNQSLQSYLGVLTHADTYELKKDLLNHFWFLLKE